jgi:UDP-N-acetyl-D-galactosamine dehydrogenase
MAAPRIVFVGLGYVSLPLAVALARKFEVVGLDRDERRIEELRRGFDRTRELDADSLRGSALTLTNTAEDCIGADVYIVTM